MNKTGWVVIWVLAVIAGSYFGNALDSIEALLAFCAVFTTGYAMAHILE